MRVLTCAAIGIELEATTETFAPFCTAVQTITTAESFGDLN